jgi:glutamate---cysteine ligase / carboxylate-amine ligase
LEELHSLQAILSSLAAKFNLLVCGGGTHPFQSWAVQKIFPTKRYKNLSRQYRYLSKRATVFGQHVHVGCETGDDAIYLTHALGRYVPQFIAICASSPFYQSLDTGYNSTRSTIFNAFPLSGVIPYLTSWRKFSRYFCKMKDLGIIESMKDFYWDVRPKPEFGTVEVRICDTPLTVSKAATIAAYIQALALYLLEERPDKIHQDLYYLYSYNRFQASRYGFEGNLINPYTSQSSSIRDDILATIRKIEPYANQLNSLNFILKLALNAANKDNDSKKLREILKQVNSYPKVVAEQCRLWSDETQSIE